MARRASAASGSLREYRAKRNFTRTPEPSGAPKAKPTKRVAKKPKLTYCIQKHLASHLHYDLRLEHNGALLSWAVPKGPSVNPADKRFARMVEDHPLEYAKFEGVIPEGYGAGIVMLWDKGTWTPQVDDVDAALRKGDLKFELHGVKLKGSWVLVRLRSQKGDGHDWLLIKHRDDWSGNVDVTELAPKSIKSFGDFEDILAQGKPDIWFSHKPPARGGETGAMLRTIIERAMKLKEKEKTARKKKPATPSRGRVKRARSKT